MADQKITELTALTAPADEDLFVIVDDPSGTPTTKKITRSNLFANGVVINEAGSDFDFRIEGVGEANALFVQGSDGYVGINSAAPTEELDVLGDFQVKNADIKVKAYRFRTSGGALDCEAGGADWYISLWTDPDFSATQRNYMVMKKDSHYMTALGSWEWKLANSVFGTTHADFVEGSGYTFNKNGDNNLDFTVKSDTYNAIFVDASNDSILLMSNAAGKIGFLGATPIIQVTTGVAEAAFTANSGTAVNDNSTFGGYTLQQIAQALQNYGLLA